MKFSEIFSNSVHIPTTQYTGDPKDGQDFRIPRIITDYAMESRSHIWKTFNYDL